MPKVGGKSYPYTKSGKAAAKKAKKKVDLKKKVSTRGPKKRTK
jgi:hypothetical protein